MLGLLGRGRHVRPTPKFTNIGLALLVILASVATSLTATSIANAAKVEVDFGLTAGTSGVGVYLDAPGIQNSYVYTDDPTNTATLLQDFNNVSWAPHLSGDNEWTCPTDGVHPWYDANVVFLNSQYGGCHLYSGDIVESFYGASTTGGEVVYDHTDPLTQTSPPFGSPFMIVQSNSAGLPPQYTEVTFAEPQKYLGFYWIAGDPGNQVELLKDGVVVATVTTADLSNMLGDAPSSLEVRSNEITTIDGLSHYKKDNYFGNPRWHRENPPASTLYGQPLNQPFTYVHMFAAEGTDFNGARFTNFSDAIGQFEIDNIVTSSKTDLEPKNSLARYNFFGPNGAATHSVRYHANNPNAIGSMLDQYSIGAASTHLSAFSSTDDAIFMGWSNSPNGAVGCVYPPDWVENSCDQEFEYSFAHDLDLYAIWAYDRTVSFDANGGTGTMDNQTSHTATALSANTFTREHFQFAGWSTSEDGDVEYGDEADFNFLESKPLYAVWYPLNKIRYFGNGDPELDDVTGSMPDQYSSGITQLSPNGFSRVGYDFAGWSLTFDGRLAYNDNDWDPFTQDRDLYALWQLSSPPVISEMTPTYNGLTDSFSKPTQANSRLQFTFTGPGWQHGHGWFLCDEEHLTYSDLNQVNTGGFASGCANLGSDSDTLPNDNSYAGKFIAYGYETFNDTRSSVGVVHGMQTVTQIQIQNLNFTAPLTRGSYTVSGASSIEANGLWMICETNEIGTNGVPLNYESNCRATSLTGIVYTPELEDIGKYAIYVVNAQANGSVYFASRSSSDAITLQQVLDAHPVDPTPTDPSPEPSPSVDPSPTPDPSPTTDPSPTPDPSSSSDPSPSVDPTPASTPTPEPSASEDRGSGLIPLTPITKYPSGESETPNDVVIEPSPLTPTQVYVAGQKVFTHRFSIFAPVKNSHIGATGNDKLAPKPFAVLDSPGSAKAFTQNLTQIFALLVGLALSSAAIGTSKSRRRGTAAPDQAEMGADPFIGHAQKWGDRLGVWNLSIARLLDRISFKAIIHSAKISPFISRMINDGAYLRAIFGPLTLVAPALATYIALNTTSSASGLLANGAWIALMLLSAISFFDAAAGLFALAVYFTITFVNQSHVDIWQDFRVMMGISLVVLGPVMVMTAFRTIRRRAAKHFSEWWERFTDVAVGPFIGAWSAMTFVTALPAIAGQTLAVANHVLLFGIVIAVFAILRVWLEEIAARGYPHRLNKLTPNEFPDSSQLQKVLSLVLRFLIWNLMISGVLGNSWQVWFGSALIMVPSVISWYQDRIPNSPGIWKVLPTGIPGLAFGLTLVTFTTTVLSYLMHSSEQLARWAFAVLPLPLIVFSVLAIVGRHGEDEFDLKPSKRNKYVYRIGGVAMLVLTMRLVGLA